MFLDIMSTGTCSSKYVDAAKTAVYEFQSDTVLRAHRSPKQQHQPSKIEDYEPGRCSLAVGNGVEVRSSYQLVAEHYVICICSFLLPCLVLQVCTDGLCEISCL